MRSVLPVLWKASCLHIQAKRRLREQAFIQSDLLGGSTDFVAYTVVKLTHWGQHQVKVKVKVAHT